jgi:hypothetical protein
VTEPYASWVDEAACATHPLRHKGAWDYDKPKLRKEAIAVCAQCPVAALCEAYAEADPATEGVFNGKVFKVRARRGSYGSESYEVS